MSKNEKAALLNVYKELVDKQQIALDAQNKVINQLKKELSTYENSKS